MNLPQDIPFATDSVAALTDLLRDLQALAGNLRAYPKKVVSIIGHTDNVGDAGYNWDPSNRRAYSVEALLLDAGTSPSHTQAYGWGKAELVASNLTAEVLARNYRKARL